MDLAEKRGEIIRHLEDALAIADEIADGETGYLIERALDAARSRLFRLLAKKIRFMSADRGEADANGAVR
jgi:hypothetical protein